MKTDILDNLLKEGTSYHVWQAVWLCEQFTRKNFPNRKDYLLDQTGLRFHPYENYEYPPTDIRNIICKNNEIIFILNFLGLYGVNSPLPRCYHEQIPIQLRTLGEDNVPLQTFYNIFNNRFYWLYYQSWKKYRFYLFIDEKPDNNVTQRIFSFAGRGDNSVKPSELHDIVMLKFSGIFSQRVRNKTSLKILLSYLFPKYDLKIKEFIPRWIDLTDCPALGDENCKLGINAFIGRTILDYMSRICIQISGINYSDYLRFLPGSFNAKRLFELMKLFVNDGLEFDIEFKINADSILSLDLSDDSLRLGSTFWLGKPKLDLVKVYINYEELQQAA